MASSEVSIVRRAIRPKKLRPARVLIFAVSAVVRAGIERLLEVEDGVEVVGSTTSFAEISTGTAENDFDVLLLSAETSTELSGILNNQLPQVPLVLLANKAVATALAEAVNVRVSGVLLADSTGAELSAALRAAAAGLAVVSSEIAKDILATLYAARQRSRIESESLSAVPEELTPREHEVLEMMVEGLSNKEIAVQLNVSVHTVKFHISSILSKLGAATRTEATTIGLRRGLITI